MEKPDKCPKCGAPVYRIQYGFPTMSEEEYFNTYHEHVIYGGCCISEDDPVICDKDTNFFVKACYPPPLNCVKEAKMDNNWRIISKARRKNGNRVASVFKGHLILF